MIVSAAQPALSGVIYALLACRGWLTLFSASIHPSTRGNAASWRLSLMALSRFGAGASYLLTINVKRLGRTLTLFLILCVDLSVDRVGATCSSCSVRSCNANSVLPRHRPISRVYLGCHSTTVAVAWLFSSDPSVHFKASNSIFEPPIRGPSGAHVRSMPALSASHMPSRRSPALSLAVTPI